MATSQRLATLQHVYIVFYQEICSKQPCQNAGSCVRNSCEPDTCVMQMDTCVYAMSGTMGNVVKVKTVRQI